MPRNLDCLSVLFSHSPVCVSLSNTFQVVHPANPINRYLLQKVMNLRLQHGWVLISTINQCPKARIAITEDEDWMSVIAQVLILFCNFSEARVDLLVIVRHRVS